MKTPRTLLVLTLAAALAACGSNEKTDDAAPAEAPAATPAETSTEAAEAPAAPEAAEPAAEAPEKPTAEEWEEAAKPKEPVVAKVDRGTDAELEKWGTHMGDVPFVIGSRRGIEAARASGKPMLIFYTATW